MEQATERHAYLARLLEEVDKMETGLFTPLAPLEKGEKVVGEVTSDYLKKLFAAAMFSAREKDQLEVESRYTPPGEGGALDKKITQARYRTDLLMEMFWACVNDDLAFPPHNTGVRAGWKIVELGEDSDPRAIIGKSLMRFFGGQRPEGGS